MKRRLSRREFFKMAGLLASAAALGACAPQAPAETETPPTATPKPPTATPPPTPTPIPPTPTPVVVAEPDGFEMVLVEPGSFEMGSTEGLSNEKPIHTVNITKPFYMAKYLVTLDQYDAYSDEANKPQAESWGVGRGNLPAPILWYDAVEYCNWLSTRSGLTPCYDLKSLGTTCDFSADGYRIPTEAEWEYAARGGNRSLGYTYAGSDDLDEVAWYTDNSDDVCHSVGEKEPNELGLYDMNGNLWEWCWDWYGKKYYESSPTDDPLGPGRGSTWEERQKVRRGGFYHSEASDVRIARRAYDNPLQFTGPGIRLVRKA